MILECVLVQLILGVERLPAVETLVGGEVGEVLGLQVVDDVVLLGELLGAHGTGVVLWQAVQHPHIPVQILP